MKVNISGVHGNSDNFGFMLHWLDEEKGFGHIRIEQSNSNGMLYIDSETMSPEFVKRVLCSLVDSCNILF